MNKKVVGTVLGVAGCLLWFMPFVYVIFMGNEAYQAGNHIGGIAYLLLISSFAYAVLSWLEQIIPSIIAATLALVICLLFLLQAGAAVAWGLIALTIVSLVSVVLAVREKQSRNA